MPDNLFKQNYYHAFLTQGLPSSFLLRRIAKVHYYYHVLMAFHAFTRDSRLIQHYQKHSDIIHCMNSKQQGIRP